ncbi:hypothetical protein IID22_00410 [Patescibacteria group bacterium]|nr:hypothetical protein [Patescibacteria group bacterium]
MAKTFKDYLKSPQAVVLLIILGVLLLVAVVYLLRSSAPESGTINPDQIRIQKGDKIVFINRNGLIEYRTADGVFYQTWDSSQVASFFALMEALALEYLANPNPSVCNTGYTVTLYVDGKEVTVCFAEDDEVLGEVFQEFSDEGNDGDLSDVFDDYFDDGNGGTGTPTPSPTPAEVAASEGEDVPPGGNGGGGGSLPVVSCELNEEDVTSRTVISNILCAPDEPSPTPTPTP